MNSLHGIGTSKSPLIFALILLLPKHALKLCAPALRLSEFLLLLPFRAAVRFAGYGAAKARNE